MPRTVDGLVFVVRSTVPQPAGKVVVAVAPGLATTYSRSALLAPGAAQLCAPGHSLRHVLQRPVHLLVDLRGPQRAVDVHPLVVAEVYEPAGAVVLGVPPGGAQDAPALVPEAQRRWLDARRLPLRRPALLHLALCGPLLAEGVVRVDVVLVRRPTGCFPGVLGLEVGGGIVNLKPGEDLLHGSHVLLLHALDQGPLSRAAHVDGLTHLLEGQVEVEDAFVLAAAGQLLYPSQVQDLRLLDESFLGRRLPVLSCQVLPELRPMPRVVPKVQQGDGALLVARRGLPPEQDPLHCPIRDLAQLCYLHLAILQAVLLPELLHHQFFPVLFVDFLYFEGGRKVFLFASEGVGGFFVLVVGTDCCSVRGLQEEPGALALYHLVEHDLLADPELRPDRLHPAGLLVLIAFPGKRGRQARKNMHTTPKGPKTVLAKEKRHSMVGLSGQKFIGIYLHET